MRKCGLKINKINIRNPSAKRILLHVGEKNVSGFFSPSLLKKRRCIGLQEMEIHVSISFARASAETDIPKAIFLTLVKTVVA